MSEYTELKVRNEEYKRVYEELKQRFESEGIDFNNMTMRLKKAITARIYLETGLIEENYTIIPKYIYTYFDTNDREILELDCTFTEGKVNTFILPSSARSGLDLVSNEVKYCDVDYIQV